MEKQIIQSNNAPAPIGPYNQAVQVGDLLFVSGQIPLDMATGNMVTSGIKDETEMVMKHLKAVLNEAGMDFSNVVKSTIFITDIGQFAQINEVYGKYFKENAPARETVQVAALPKAANVEISVIAAK